MTVFAPPRFAPPRKLDAVTIAVTTWCNLQCRGCGRTLGVEAGRWRNQHMSKEDFATIVAHLPPARVGVLQGVGEPTIHPDFLEICTIARQSGKFDSLMFHTNGVTRTVEYLEALSRCVDRMVISVDTLTPELIAQTRTGTDVAKLRQTLQGLAERRVRVAVNMVASRFNRDDIATTLHALHAIGVQAVRIQPFDAGADGEGALLPAELAALQASVEALMPALPALSIELALAPQARQAEPQFCAAHAPALAPYVLPDGHLTPCCRSDNIGKLGRANLVASSFDAVWRSEAVQAYLHRWIEGGDAMCLGCPKDGRTATPRDAGDAEAVVEHLLRPAVDFALSFGDAAQALRFCRAVEGRFGDHPVVRRCLRQAKDAGEAPCEPASLGPS